MLEQYRKDLPNEDKDLLSDGESKMGTQKVVLFVSGAALAVVAFLLFTGAFSKGEEGATEHVQVELASKESVLQVEEKLQALQAKFDKLETELKAAQISSIAQVSAPAPSLQEAIIVQAPLATVEEGVAMTNDSLRKLIAKDATPKPEPVVAKASPKSKKQEVAKATKSKGKSSNIAVNTTDGKHYVVQNGDTLSKISSKYFGTPNRWKAIYDANRERIANINRLKVGTKLIIPEVSK